MLVSIPKWILALEWFVILMIIVIIIHSLTVAKPPAQDSFKPAHTQSISNQKDNHGKTKIQKR
jgi:hypothetical protein